MLGLYFFVDDYRIEHTRSVYNVEQILSEIGGIATSLIAGFGIIATVYNYYIYVKHIIYLLYFINDEKETEKSGFLTRSGRKLSNSLRGFTTSDVESPAINLSSKSSSSSSDEYEEDEPSKT